MTIPGGQITYSWHVDGHKVYFEIQQSEVNITAWSCPHGNDTVGKDCHHRGVGCIVNWFINRYGLDCNVGICPPQPEMEIAWSIQGDGDDLDLTQVWITFLDDPLFGSWIAEQRGEIEDASS